MEDVEHESNTAVVTIAVAVQDDNEGRTGRNRLLKSRSRVEMWA